MNTETINIRKLIAAEGKLIISKNLVEDPETGIKVPEVYAKELYLGSEANVKDYEETSEEDFNALLQRVQEAKEALAKEREAAKEEDKVESEEKENQDDSN